MFVTEKRPSFILVRTSLLPINSFRGFSTIWYVFNRDVFQSFIYFFLFLFPQRIYSFELRATNRESSVGYSVRLWLLIIAFCLRDSEDKRVLNDCFPLLPSIDPGLVFPVSLCALSVRQFMPNNICFSSSILSLRTPNILARFILSRIHCLVILSTRITPILVVPC